MLDDYAAMVLQSEVRIFSAFFLVTCAGYLSAIWMRRGRKDRIGRMHYLAILASTYALANMLNFMWVFSFFATVHYLLWLLVFAVAIGIFLIGFGHGLAGQARAVDAFGDDRKAWYGMVPLFNLALIFVGPSDRPNTPRERDSAGLSFLVASIGIFMVGQGVGKVADQAISTAAEQAESDPVYGNIQLARNFRLKGLDQTLSEIAANTPMFRVDEWTELISAEAESGVLRFTYRLDPVPDDLFPALESNVPAANCAEPSSVIILQAGAVIEHVYQDSETAPLGQVRITLRDCSEPV